MKDVIRELSINAASLLSFMLVIVGLPILVVWCFDDAKAQTAYIPGACELRKELMPKITGKYKEKQVAVGLSNGGGLIEIYRSEERETYSIFITGPNGRTCAVSFGKGLRFVEKAELPPKI